MYKQHITYTAMMMGLIVVITLFLNFLALVPPTPQTTLLDQKEVRSIAIESKGHSYLFNPEQQNELVQLLNQGTTMQSLDIKKLKEVPPEMNSESITIEQFNNQKIELSPIGLFNNKITYKVEGLTEPSYLIIASDREKFQELLNSLSQ